MRSAAENGQAGRGDRRVDGGNGSSDQRGAVLDLARGVLWRSALHGNEYDEREPDVQRLRGGHLRRDRDARLAAGLGDAQRAARLEQQLRRRSRQGGLLPLQQSAQAFLPGSSYGFPADYRRNRGSGAYLWDVRGAGEIRAHELRAVLDE